MPAPQRFPSHGDAGLQPERTDLAWGRTTLSMAVAAAVFLRWLPHHGWFVGSLVGAAILTATAINATRKRRYHRAILGITQEHMPPDIVSTAAVGTPRQQSHQFLQLALEAGLSTGWPGSAST